MAWLQTYGLKMRGRNYFNKIAVPCGFLGLSASYTSLGISTGG